MNPAPPPRSPCPQMSHPHNFYFSNQGWWPHHFPGVSNAWQYLCECIWWRNFSWYLTQHLLSKQRNCLGGKGGLDAVSHRPYNSTSKFFIFIGVIHIFHQEWEQRFCSVFQKIFFSLRLQEWPHSASITVPCFVQMHWNPFSFSMNGSTPVSTATSSKRF